MSPTRLIALTALTMLAFAGNSLLCRMALEYTSIDPASFTTIRVISGALTLWILVQLRGGHRTGPPGNWLSALALFAYAAGFSFAYVSLTAASGALMLFVAVQATMIGHGVWTGERFRHLQIAGLVLALGGLVGLLLPGLSAPPLGGSILMLAAGAAWGIYSLRGKGAGDPLAATAGNFLRAVPIAVLMSVLLLRQFTFDSSGFWHAIVSGAIASGMGYAIWYTVLPSLRSTDAATVQLSVPVIAAVGGVILLEEPVTLRLVVASVAILGGIALVIQKRTAPSAAAKRPVENFPRQ
ncbi:MAG TPA: DMT family transporter [Woeseiaceae bacterium]|nr:DMT family transporter [Woeseiaceae bacterium]